MTVKTEDDLNTFSSVTKGTQKYTDTYRSLFYIYNYKQNFYIGRSGSKPAGSISIVLR